jgi:type IV secretory pathway VirB2 component (pilin)
MNVTAPNLDGSSLAAASIWIAELLQGRLATTIAVLAVAILGYQMITGRVSARSALQVMLGGFILFGSSAIARGLIYGAGGRGPTLNSIEFNQPTTVTAAKPVVIPPPAPQKLGADPFDPYAGSNP